LQQVFLKINDFKFHLSFKLRSNIMEPIASILGQLSDRQIMKNIKCDHCENRWKTQKKFTILRMTPETPFKMVDKIETESEVIKDGEVCHVQNQLEVRLENGITKDIWDRYFVEAHIFANSVLPRAVPYIVEKYCCKNSYSYIKLNEPSISSDDFEMHYNFKWILSLGDALTSVKNLLREEGPGMGYFKSYSCTEIGKTITDIGEYLLPHFWSYHKFAKAVMPADWREDHTRQMESGKWWKWIRSNPPRRNTI